MKPLSVVARILFGMFLAIVLFATDVLRATRDAAKELLELNAQHAGYQLAGNTITNLIPLLYAALDTVSRELVGFIPAVARDSSAERAALNQTVNIYIAPPATTADITPGVTAPNDGDQTFGNTTMTISKSKYSPVRWNGEEQLSMSTNPVRYRVVQDQFTQSMRALVNLVETDLAVAAYQAASRAYGTAGTTPFGTAADLSDIAQVLKILDDNGAPATDRHLVLGTAAIANLRGKQSVLFKVNEAGTADLLRNGTIGQLESAMVHTSAQVQTPTKGTGASYTTNSAGYAVGATDITLITGTGTILAGDVVTFAGDSNKYVVKTALAGGVISLASPGLRVAIAASPTAVTVGNTATQNILLQRGYVQLATRTPAMPEGGDAADDMLDITDPVSGLSFQVAVYRQYRQVRYEVGLAWGTKAIKGDGIAVLLG